MKQQMLTQSSTANTDSDGVQFGLNTVRTSAMTFTSEKVFEWVISQIPSGARVLNSCAGETKLEEAGENISVVRNDINPDRDADLHVDVANIADHLPTNSFDYIIHDPPFSASESEGTYQTGNQTRYGEETISQFRRLLKPGGQLMIWGYSPHSYPEFEVSRVHLWNRVGRGKDYNTTILTYAPDSEPPAAFHASQTVPFNPVIPGVTGGATFGGNQGQPVELSITVDPTTDTSSQILDEIDRQKEGLTLIITDVDRDYTRIKDQNTAIISLIDSDGDKQTGDLNLQADDWIGVRQLSEAIPENTIETVVLDLNPAAFSWNTYYDGSPDSDWRETATETGYPKALKQESQKVLTNTEGAKLIQVAPTATNTPGDSPFIRSHIALTVPNEAKKIGSPFITVDERAYTADESDAEATDPDTLFYPTSRHTGEQKPSDLRHTNGTEGTYLRPAYQYVCPNCGAAQMNLCISDEGNPVPVGTVHNERAARENEFYDGELALPLYEHVRGWIAQTDPARPQTAGGENETPTKQAVSDGGSTTGEPSMSLAMF